MDRFYPDIESLDAFTLSLDGLGETIRWRIAIDVTRWFLMGLFIDDAPLLRSNLSANGCFVPIDMAARDVAEPISYISHTTFHICAMVPPSY